MSKTTVLGLDPAFFPVMRVWMKNFATTGGRTYRKVRYPNIPSARNAEKGMKALDDALHSVAGPKIVFGHSMGAQVAYKWLREMGPSSDIDPADVSFLCAGNPERKYGGALMVPEPPKLWGFYTVQPSYGGPGIPDDVRYKVIDYARRRDWWADQPDSRSPFAPASRKPSQGVHCDYFRVGFDGPDVAAYTEGNRVYKLQGGRLR